MIGPDGEADYVGEIKQAAGQSACDIRFLGPQPNEAIRDLYAAADFFCLTGLPDTTGRVEGFGLVYLEAGAAGLPSVATEVGGVPDAVLADETGILVPPSVVDISEAIVDLATDRGLRAILAAGASAHARALSWERCAATTYGLAQAGKGSSAVRATGTTA
jgi:glycosyltransferase involved in cell wall biosynthesis